MRIKERSTRTRLHGGKSLRMLLLACLLSYSAIVVTTSSTLTSVQAAGPRRNSPNIAAHLNRNLSRAGNAARYRRSVLRDGPLVYMPHSGKDEVYRYQSTHQKALSKSGNLTLETWYRGHGGGVANEPLISFRGLTLATYLHLSLEKGRWARRLPKQQDFNGNWHLFDVTYADHSATLYVDGQRSWHGNLAPSRATPRQNKGWPHGSHIPKFVHHGPFSLGSTH